MVTKKFHGKILVLVLLLLTFVVGVIPAWSAGYYIYKQWGGTWHDVNKTYTDDSLMCWAASAANILDWGNWDALTYDTDTEIFEKIKYHWTNNYGWPNWAWNWWITGSPPPYKIYSYIDVPGGGGYFPGTSFYGNYAIASGAGVMSSMDQLMRQGYGVTVVIANPKGGSHAVTAWGFGYNVLPTTIKYYSIFLTDSDDRTTAIKSAGLAYDSTKGWYLTSGYVGWKITGIYALKMHGITTTSGTTVTASGTPTGAVSGYLLEGAPGDMLSEAPGAPLLPTWMLVATGLLILRFRRKFAKI